MTFQFQLFLIKFVNQCKVKQCNWLYLMARPSRQSHEIRTIRSTASGNAGIISGWVSHGQRPDEAAIPEKFPSKIKQLMKKCWHQESKGRPTFSSMILSNNVFIRLSSASYTRHHHHHRRRRRRCRRRRRRNHRRRRRRRRHRRRRRYDHHHYRHFSRRRCAIVVIVIFLIFEGIVIIVITIVVVGVVIMITIDIVFIVVVASSSSTSSS